MSAQDILNGISTHARAIKLYITQKENLQQMTYEKLKESNYQMSIFGLSDRPVKTSVLPENKKALLKAEEAPCSLRLSDCLKNELGGEDVTFHTYHGEC